MDNTIARIRQLLAARKTPADGMTMAQFAECLGLDYSGQRAAERVRAIADAAVADGLLEYTLVDTLTRWGIRHRTPGVRIANGRNGTDSGPALDDRGVEANAEKVRRPVRVRAKANQGKSGNDAARNSGDGDTRGGTRDAAGTGRGRRRRR